MARCRGKPQRDYLFKKPLCGMQGSGDTNFHRAGASARIRRKVEGFSLAESLWGGDITLRNQHRFTADSYS